MQNDKMASENEKEMTESEASIASQPDEAMPVAEAGADGEVVESEETALDKALQQIEEFKVALQRERADFINFRKRAEREKAEMRSALSAEILMKFIPIVDDFNRAMTVLSDEVKNNEWVTGFTLIHKKFLDLLDNAGIVEINPLGQPFDPNFHEVIGMEDSDGYPSQHVIAVLQKGYALENKCLRPAMVKVAN